MPIRVTSTRFRIAVASLIVILGIYVAMSPNVVYAPVPKIVLYTLISLLPAILFGAEAAAQFRMSGPGFAATCGGAAAVAMTLLLMLTKFSKPEHQIAVFEVEDQRGHPVMGLEEDGSVQLSLATTGLTVTSIISGHRLVLIFPEQVPEVRVRIQLPGSAAYSGTVGYAGSRKSTLVLGRDLKELK